MSIALQFGFFFRRVSIPIGSNLRDLPFVVNDTYLLCKVVENCISKLCRPSDERKLMALRKKALSLMPDIESKIDLLKIISIQPIKKPYELPQDPFQALTEYVRVLRVSEHFKTYYYLTHSRGIEDMTVDSLDTIIGNLNHPDFRPRHQDLIERAMIDFIVFSWETDKNLFDLLKSMHSQHQKYDLESLIAFEHALFSQVNSILDTSEFKAVKERADARRDCCEQEWVHNFEKSYEHIMRITGLTDFDQSRIILCLSPGLRGGRNLSNGYIEWGGSDFFENYTTIYIWHEILHDIFPRDCVAHALIQLIADQELTKCLNGTEYNLDNSHENERMFMQLVLSQWQLFLMQPEKDIMIFLNQLREVSNGNPEIFPSYY